MSSNQSIFFIGKRDNHNCEQAEHYIKRHFKNCRSLMLSRGDKLSEMDKSWCGDYIISYLSPAILPKKLLENVGIAALNFHPGPPEYPGIGCTNFAVYDAVREYGVTCHHMKENVDTGDIVFVERFKVYETDDVYGITNRCYAHLQLLFYNAIDLILNGINLPVSTEQWTRKPYTRTELNNLAKVSLDMSQVELSRRLKALDFPGAQGAYLSISDLKISLIDTRRPYLKKGS